MAAHGTDLSVKGEEPQLVPSRGEDIEEVVVVPADLAVDHNRRRARVRLLQDLEHEKAARLRGRRHLPAAVREGGDEAALVDTKPCSTRARIPGRDDRRRAVEAPRRDRGPPAIFVPVHPADQAGSWDD